MINLTNLYKQHDTITAEIKSILSEAEKDISFIDATAAAYHISILAGQLKMHLLHEDKFLYPDLLSCSDEHIKELTEQYRKEMGSLAEEYTLYKNSYNTKNKINGNMLLFQQATFTIMGNLKTRMEKEDTELYRLIQEKGL